MWEDLLAKVKSVAPILFKPLHSCIKTRKERKNQNATIGALIAIV